MVAVLRLNYVIVCCPFCKSVQRTDCFVTVSDIEDAVKALIKITIANVEQTPLPLDNAYVEVNTSLNPKIRFSDPRHPAAQLDYHDLHPIHHTQIHTTEDGLSQYYIQAEAADRWYTVVRGREFHGVVHGAALYESLTRGVKGSRGLQMPTRQAAEHAWRVAHACQDLRVLHP